MGWQLQCIGASTTCNELHWRSALMFVQVALGQCTALVCRVHSGRLPIRQMMQTEQSRRKTGAAIQLRPTKTLPTNAKYKYKAILNTNTYQCKIQIQKCKIQIQSNSESPNHKADRQNTNKKNCKGLWRMSSVTLCQSSQLHKCHDLSFTICQDLSWVTRSLIQLSLLIIPSL